MNAIAEQQLRIVEDWTLQEYESVSSTNLVAAELPAWSAVRAESQTAGRGRFQRQWISDRGGLWLSAVIPTASPNCRILPLLAGLAVCDVLHGFGVRHLRLRWPNDVLVRDRKLAGVLIDQFKPGLAVIGIGLNIGNQPADYDATLQNQIERLADLLPTPPPIEDLTALLLIQIRSHVRQLNDGESKPLLARVNPLWNTSRRVELDLDGEIRRGRFAGVDNAGRLLLIDSVGATATYNPEEVRHLTEIPESHE